MHAALLTQMLLPFPAARPDCLAQSAVSVRSPPSVFGCLQHGERAPKHHTLRSCRTQYTVHTLTAPTCRVLCIALFAYLRLLSAHLAKHEACMWLPHVLHEVTGSFRVSAGRWPGRRRARRQGNQTSVDAQGNRTQSCLLLLDRPRGRPEGRPSLCVGQRCTEPPSIQVHGCRQASE